MIVVACAAGNRSATVAAALSARGFLAESLAGGAGAWVAMEPDE
jgi:rhodanese-related sulfurtransferase